MPNRALILLWVGLLPVAAAAQTPADLVLPVRVQDVGGALRFSWPAQTGHTDFIVLRKTRTTTAWVPQDTLAPTDTVWTTPATPGQAFEYQIIRRGSSPTASYHGYAGADFAPAHPKGGLVVVADSTYALPLATELQTLAQDLYRDGWRVHWLWATRTQSPASIRAQIQDLRTQYPDLRGVYLVGHVPVPYSGNMAPDGHSPDHQGAWPADVFYGELDADWNDIAVNNAAAARPENQNIPGDGKYDPNTLQANGSKADLFVGRADFLNLTDFPTSDTALLANYLTKCHGYRTGAWALPLRCIIDDNFGYFSGESFATSGWRMGTSIAGPHVTAEAEWDDLRTQPALLAYGTGPGTYTSVGGVVTTADFVADTFQTAFTLLFGSYHGDWDTPNNVMRAALASGPYTLTCGWAGRPHWFIHPFALGEVLGQSLLGTQNNYAPTQYAPAGNFLSGTHIALMGDPALRLTYPAPAASLVADTLPGGAQIGLAWVPGPGQNTLAGWVLYRASHLDSTWLPLATVPPATLSYTDTLPFSGPNHYRLCAQRRDTTNGGTYLNLSLAVQDSAFAILPTVGVDEVAVGEGIRLYPNPTRGNAILAFAAPLHAAGTARILNANGQEVARHPLPPGTQQINLPTADLPAGVYWVLTPQGGARLVCLPW